MKRSHLVIVALLAAGVLVSAIAVVHSKYRSRQLFAELKQLDRRADRLDIEWNGLLIEHGTWGAPQRIEAEARKRLKMRLPRADEIVIIKEQ
ncbi:MAG: cell division protein FtsL [Gammaproteobacteria bacterium]|nr:MAG: cell division protein FtsL [Gammaproteobacteria bacterium]RTZ73830.1 MAG: cell division protein FtsL [Gammaproteobacteria bacterium]